VVLVICTPSSDLTASAVAVAGTFIGSHGAELIGELVQYQDSYRLCYLRGPAGIIVALSEDLS
jgi:hypothetical protein